MDSRKLLLIDDDRLQARIVQQQLKAFHGEVYAFEWAATYEEGLQRLLSGEHTACLLDFQLGPRDGLELIREAKEAGCEVPIIFLTAESSSSIDIEAMNAGALDYLVKGEISASMLERSLRYALKLSETLAELKRLATHDALTGLLNRREFNRILAEETERAKRFGRDFSLVLLDLDHFKSVNDTHGHPAGDAVLRETARRLGGLMRKVDRLARFGGEELAVLLVELDAEAARKLATRIVEVVHGTPYPLDEDGKELTVTISAGVAAMPHHATTAKALVQAADKALYAAKSNGRDRVEVAE
ncbi:GGDEF domain-containing response regulator [Actomonas aquatica]|uniref:diguanylate cyclase n=1 Tax=Actomonas aquatica TaxID=2866162 RepID=A0ABZ1CCG8_9BACT|nr:diguanylate cyclase [Opitutus sp. WL0086]WRQ89131.1 diguanylate cyclase [Opitutus sp. WL0086]